MARPHPWRPDAERPQDIWEAVTWHLLDLLEPDEEAAKMVSEITRTYFAHDEAAVDEALSTVSVYRDEFFRRAADQDDARGGNWPSIEAGTDMPLGGEEVVLAKEPS